LPSRGLVAAAALIGVALTALATLRKWERERRLLGRLRQAETVAMDRLSEEERYTAQMLQHRGVVRIRGRQVQVDPDQYAAFRARHLRAILSGACIGLVLATLVVVVVLRR
jgi:CHASE1-domain containing sensor protein